MKHLTRLFEYFRHIPRYGASGGLVGPGEVPQVLGRSEPHHEQIMAQMIARKHKPGRDIYFMGFANHAATASKDSTKVGAVLVGPKGEIRLSGYNGPPRGVKDLPERFERPAKYLFASHAEANLVAFAAREGIRTEGCTVYVTHKCCAGCARTLIQAGIRRVVYGPGTTSMPAQEFSTGEQMFREAGVVCEPCP